MAASDSLSGSGSAHHMISHHHHHHHHFGRHRVPSSGEEESEEEELDPRIQIELEKLNRSSEEINRLELELDDARAAFRQVLSDSTQRLNGLAKKLGACVDKARPYYDARMRLKEAHVDSQKAALRFERACSMHEAAKEMVQLAEEGYKRRELDLDPTWQEMLNHATMKVNDAERERIESEDFHQRTTVNFKHREEDVQRLQKDLKRAITKSKPYFEMKAKFNQVMEEHKSAVSRLEEDVSSSKSLYSQALRSLEAISDDIHRQRLERRQKLQLGVRGAGVGAEDPSPPPFWEKGINIEGSSSCNVFDSDADDDYMSASRVSHGSSETVLDVKQMKKNRAKGIVCYESAFRKKESLTEAFIMDGSFSADPLDLVVFRTQNCSADLSQVAAASQNQSRSCSHSAGQSFREDSQGWPRKNRDGSEEEFGENVVTPTPDNILELSYDLRSGQGKDAANRRWEVNLSGSPKADSLLSESSRKRDIELSQASLSRAQEWVNKSPIPQQKKFVKSKSLVDASSSSLSFSSPTDSELSSSLTSDLMKDVVVRDGRDHLSAVTHGLSTSTRTHKMRTSDTDSMDEAAPMKHYDRTNNDQPSLVSSSAHLTSAQYARFLEREMTPEQSPPLSGSPSSNRKSPKLQGLILRVEATGISTSTAQTVVQQSQCTISTSTQSSGHNPKVIISTQHPKLGVFSEKLNQLQSPPSTTSSTMHPSSLTPLSLSPSAKPPASLIAQHLNKMMNVTKVSQYNSKTAPATLSTSYHLPTSSPMKSPHGYPPTSPTRVPLSPLPSSTATCLRHQLISPTPSSPSADRYSISGRSDSLTSGSHKSAFLKPPSDSSDTESIASTGPMLDDDQVELINMDFTEQSIVVDNQEDNDFGLISSDSGLNRGHWSRMSLPPRLSYLDGFLERARFYSADKKTLESSNDKHCNDDDDNNDDANDDDDNQNDSGSARSSVAMSGECDDNDDFKEEDCDFKEKDCDFKEKDCDFKEEDCDFKEEDCDFKEEDCDFKEEDCDLKTEKKKSSQDVCVCSNLKLVEKRHQTEIPQEQHSENLSISFDICLDDTGTTIHEDAGSGFVIVEVPTTSPEGNGQITKAVSGHPIDVNSHEANTTALHSADVANKKD